MSLDFRPFEGFGPLRFGMSSQEALERLGGPSQTRNLYESMAHLIDPKVIGKDTIGLLRRTVTISFADSPTNNGRPELSFVDDRLRMVHLQHKRDSLVVRDVDLWHKDRCAVIRSLAAGEDVVLFTGSDYYFESVGLRVTAPRFWKTSGSIGLYSREGLLEEFGRSAPYEYDPAEITGKER